MRAPEWQTADGILTAEFRAGAVWHVECGAPDDDRAGAVVGECPNCGAVEGEPCKPARDDGSEPGAGYIMQG